MRSTPWLAAMLSALAALGLISCPTSLVTAQEQDDKKPAVIILKLQTSEVTGKEGIEEGDDKDADDDEDDDDKEMKEGDDDDDEDEDKESKSNKKKAGKKKSEAKKPKEKKSAKRPKSKPEGREERHSEPQRDQPRPGEAMGEGRPVPDHRRPDEQRPEEPRRDRQEQDRPNPNRPERGFQFRWEGEGPRPPQREEGRGGPPEEMRHQMEQQREQMMRQREEIERRADEMRQQAERMRREIEERAREIERSRDQGRQTEQRSHELAERLKDTEQKLEQRSQEVQKLKIALEERERAIIELKQALAKQSEKLGEVVKPKQPQKVTDKKPIDPALIGRIEKLETEIRKLMEVMKQQSQPRFQPKAIEQPKVKDGELKEQSSKPKVTVPDGGTIIMGGQRRGRAPIVSAAPRSPSFNSKMQSLTRGIPAESGAVKPQTENSDVPPPTPLPDPDPIAPAAVKPVGAIDAASVGGVGIVEGDVVTLLPQEGKFVLKVSTWHDGKQVRADWVGQQVSINQGNLPALKPGDHVALDARIEGQKGLIWGGKVFQTK